MNTAIRVFVIMLAAATATAETYRNREITVTIDSDGFTEREFIEVELENTGDLESWSVYPVILDQSIELEAFAAEVRRADGSREKVSRRKLRKQTSVGFGLHTSTYAMMADFPSLAIGDVIHLDLTRRFTTSYPAHRMILGDKAAQQSLAIHVRGGGDRLRWRLSGWNDRLEIQESPDGLTITGGDLDGIRPRAHEPDGVSWYPTLWLAWDESGTWDGVALWYATLLDAMPAAAPSVAELADRLTANLDHPRDRLLAVTDYTKTNIRYEAVEIGEGSYVPSLPDEVISRGWGDCKDKSMLLVDLLAAVDIPAHMVLIRSGRELHTTAEFPTSLVFNHAIVAVPADGLDLADDDPVVDGFLFIDPTQDRGGPIWLNPHIQGALAVVVDGAEARVARIPVQEATERSELAVTARVDSLGTLTGTVVRTLQGERALAWVRGIDTIDPARLDQVIRESFQLTLPGVKLAGVRLEETETDLPRVTLSATIRIPSFVGRAGSLVRFRPSIMNPVPDTRALDDRNRPIVVDPGVERTVWEIELPNGWCPVQPVDTEISNGAGSFAHRVAMDGETSVRIEAEVSFGRWWFTADEADDLRELGIAASRAARRSVRLRCPGAGG